MVDSPIYNHPNLRDLTAEQFVERLANIRNRRLLAALDFKAAREERLERLGTKLSAQYETLAERIRKRLVKMEEDVKMTDGDINKLQVLSHKLKMTEEGIDL